MFALTVMPKSAVASLLRLSRLDILQQLRGLSLSSSHHIDSFIDKEFEKAETNLDTETLDDPYTLLKKLERYNCFLFSPDPFVSPFPLTPGNLEMAFLVVS